MKKNLKRLTATLLLGLGAFAGAQVASCTAPTPPTIPQFSTWTHQGTNVNTGANYTPNDGDLSYGSNGTEPTLLFYTDYAARQNTFTATSPTVVSLGNVRYLEFGFAWANNGQSGGESQTINFKFGNTGNLTTYLTLTTPGPSSSNVDSANALPQNGAILYDDNGVPTSSIALPSIYAKTHNLLQNAVVNLQLSYNNGVQARKLFYIKLPDSAPASGYMQVEVPGDPNGKAFVYGDDFRIWLPAATPTTLCLMKQLDKGTVPNNFQFTTTGLDNLVNADSASTPNQITINIPQLSSAYAKTTTPSTVSNPGTVTLTENASGFTVTKVDCTKPAPLVNSTPSNTKVTVSGSTATVTALTFGTMTTCKVYNSDNSQIDYPKFTLTKNYTGYHKSSDKVNISIAETGGASTNKDVNNSDTYTDTVILTGTKLNFGNSDTTTNTVSSGTPPIFTLGESFLRGTPGNYTKTYSCSNATSGGTTFTTTSTTLTGAGNGPYQFTVNPKQGDNITCTITNNLTVQPPTTTIVATKTGANYITQGQSLTYTITVNVPSSATNDASNVVVTDTLPTGATFVSASGNPASAPAVGSTGKIVWNLGTVTKGSTTTFTVVANAPSATGANGSQTLDTNSITNNVDVTSDTDTDSNSVLNSSKTTAVLFASINKQVRNVTQNGTLSDSAQANPGEKLEYCLNYRNYSGTVLDTLSIKDTLQNGQTLIANGEVSGDVKITRNGTTTYASNTDTTNINQVLTNVALNETGSVCFQALIPKS